MSSIVSNPGVFTSVSRPPVPFVGQMIIESDTGKVMVYYGTTLRWLPRWNYPWGFIASVESPTTISWGVLGSPVNTGIAVSWNTLLGRKYLVEGIYQLRHAGGVTSTGAFVQDELGTAFSMTQSSLTSGTSSDTTAAKRNDMGAYLQGTGGLKTVTLWEGAGAGGGEFTASATQLIQIQVRDIGPYANPVIT